MRLFDSIPLSAALLLAPSLTSAFYLPGVAPTSYHEGDKVPLNVNILTPAFSQQDDQLHSAFAFPYYHPAFRFCRPEGGPKDVRESLGSIIFGDRIQTSPFELFMAKNESCKSLCEEKKFDPRNAKFVNRKIWQTYNINWLVDGLPAAQRSEDPLTKEPFYSPGFFLGSIGENNVPMLNNHYDIIIDYHRAGMRGDQYRVVGVLVQPRSVRDSKNLGDGKAECGSRDDAPLILDQDGQTSVTWTYGVYWRESSTTWATRWDNYLHVFDPKIHWFSLINSSIFVVFLSGMVSMILLRALRKDIARYNRLDAFNLDDLSGTAAGVEDGVQEDSGWKLVHGDVFRCPKHPLLLSVFLGNGAQLFVMTGLTVGMFYPPREIDLS
jgi:transmembrane 9 superfamily protein 2/4